MPVADRLHDGTDGQAVEIVVNEDQHAEHERGEHGACAGLDVRLGPAAKGGGAARAVDERDHDAENDEEQEDTGVVGNGGHNAVVNDRVERPDWLEVRIEQAAEQDADEEGGVDLLRDQRQRDGDDRRNERPETERHAAVRRERAGAFAFAAFFAVYEAGAFACGADDAACGRVFLVRGERKYGEHGYDHDDKRQNGQNSASCVHCGVLQNKNVVNKVLFTTLQKHRNPSSMTALRLRDSPPDILRRPRNLQPGNCKALRR